MTTPLPPAASATVKPGCHSCGDEPFYMVEPLEGDYSDSAKLTGPLYSCRQDVADVADLVSDETQWPAVLTIVLGA